MNYSITSIPVVKYPYYVYDTTSKPLSLSNIYEGIYNNISNCCSNYNLVVKSGTDEKIRKKIKDLEWSENEITKMLTNEELKKLLAKRSQGYINPDKISDKDLPMLLEKHSNLLQGVRNYNSKVIRLADILQSLNEILVAKTSANVPVPVVSTVSVPVFY